MLRVNYEKYLKIALIFLLIVAGRAYGAEPIYTGIFSNSAVGGYDTVSFFTQEVPAKGSNAFQTQWRGADWYFISAENLEKFKKSPEKYAPQYGGYCAWAMAKGELAKGTPKYWHIEDDKLYLNYNEKIQNLWLSDKAEFIKKSIGKYRGLVDPYEN